MPAATFDGVFYRRGIGGDPVVFIDDPTLINWWTQNSIFTQVFRHPHPGTGALCPTIYISKPMARPFRDGDPVTITIDVRPEKRGNGIKTVKVV
jgi:hypothetical protein